MRQTSTDDKYSIAGFKGIINTVISHKSAHIREYVRFQVYMPLLYQYHKSAHPIKINFPMGRFVQGCGISNFNLPMGSTIDPLMSQTHTLNTVHTPTSWPTIDMFYDHIVKFIMLPFFNCSQYRKYSIKLLIMKHLYWQKNAIRQILYAGSILYMLMLGGEHWQGICRYNTGPAS